MPKKLHHKPSKEELEENIRKVTEELDSNPSEPIPSETPSEPAPTPVPEPAPEPQPTPEPEPPVDYKKKFIESTREAQVLHAKNKKINEALDKAIQSPLPTDEDIMREFPDWEVMSDFEKRMAKESLSNKKALEALGEIAKENKDIEGWQAKVDTFVDNPETMVKHPQLDGRQDEFRLFATKPTRRGVDFEDLIPAFLYNEEMNKPTTPKKRMFEVGTGGPSDNPRPKAGKITLDEAATLKKNDYKKYVEYIKAGKVDIEEL